MRRVLIDKIPFLRMCREVLTLEFGLLDYDDLIECLCEQIHGSEIDRGYIRDIAYADTFFQGHQETSLTESQKERLLKLLMNIYYSIIEQLHYLRSPIHSHIRFVHTGSRMSLAFDVI